MIRLRPLRPREKRNLRHWAMEFAIVVVGVLIALWASEWADGRAKLKRMADAEKAMALELNRAAAYLAMRQAVQECADEQRARLTEAVKASEGRWDAYREHSLWKTYPESEPGHVGGVVQVPTTRTSDAAWQSALATGALDAMDRERFSQYVLLYDDFKGLQDIYADEEAAAFKLSTMTTDFEMTPELKQGFLEALFGWSWASSRMVRYERFASTLEELGIADRQTVQGDLDIFEAIVWAPEQSPRPCLKRAVNSFAD